MRRMAALLFALVLLWGIAAAGENAGLPGDATCAFPVSAGRAVHAENEDTETVLFFAENRPAPVICCIVPDDTAPLRIGLPASDDPEAVLFRDLRGNVETTVASLLDASRWIYAYDQAVPSAESEYRFNAGSLFLAETGAEDPDRVDFYLVRSDEFLPDVAEDLRAAGGVNIRWEYAEPAREEPAPAAYILHLADQDNQPVPGVMANFCTDTACTLEISGPDGTITFTGPPDSYHVQLLKVPDGYSFDAGYEMYTGPGYGEWVLRIRKNRTGKAGSSGTGTCLLCRLFLFLPVALPGVPRAGPYSAVNVTDTVAFTTSFAACTTVLPESIVADCRIPMAFAEKLLTSLP